MADLTATVLPSADVAALEAPALAARREIVQAVSTGTQSPRTLGAAELLGADGLDVGVVHLPVLKPLDGSGVLAAIGGRRLVVTVEERTIAGGLGGAVAELLAEASGPQLRRIGLHDEHGESGPNDALLEHYGLSSARVADQVRTFLTELRR